MHDALENLARRFTSGNGVPVDSARITREEFEHLRAGQGLTGEYLPGSAGQTHKKEVPMIPPDDLFDGDEDSMNATGYNATSRYARVQLRYDDGNPFCDMPVGTMSAADARRLAQELLQAAESAERSTPRICPECGAEDDVGPAYGTIDFESMEEVVPPGDPWACLKCGHEWRSLD